MPLYSPHIISPVGTEIFNLGTVLITWDKNDPPSDDLLVEGADVTYDIEYTENFKHEDTDWQTLKRRIPWSDTSYTWAVGKMVKSENVRVRIRAVHENERSDWSMSGGDFSINVFKLVAPAIVNPVSNKTYIDSVMIILDETLVFQTFSQKVRYTLEYSSKKADTDWTIIQKDIPVGRNIIRWDIDNVVSSDDYVLRLTAKDDKDPPDQLATRFVYNLDLQNPGLFLIDTKPPQSILEVEGGSTASNKLRRIVNVFSQDSTTQVEKIQLCERNTDSLLALGDTALVEQESEEECPSVEDATSTQDLGKPLGYSTKLQWNFRDESGLKKLEAILTDTGGNVTINNKTKVFINLFQTEESIQDFVLVTEQREFPEINTTVPPSVSVSTKTVQVLYLITSGGEVWVLEPFSRLVHSFSESIELNRIILFDGIIYVFAYSAINDEGQVYRLSVSSASQIDTFDTPMSIAKGVAEFQDDLYVGFQNGELWKYNGSVFSQVGTTFGNPIETLYGNRQYLHIGFANSPNLTLYNGTTFSTLNLEPT